MWEKNAYEVINIYGGYVDWEERFYLCPECGEPIYECDWTRDELEHYLCPVCEFDGEDEDDEPDWIDDDCGFDPYMGCFTGDC